MSVLRKTSGVHIGGVPATLINASLTVFGRKQDNPAAKVDEPTRVKKVAEANQDPSKEDVQETQLKKLENISAFKDHVFHYFISNSFRHFKQSVRGTDKFVTFKDSLLRNRD